MKGLYIAASVALAIALQGCMGAPAGPAATPGPVTLSPQNPTPMPTGTTVSVQPTPMPSGTPPSARSTLGPTVGSSSGSIAADPLDTAIRLRWPPAAGAHGYLVYRDGSSIPLNVTPISETTYEDVGLSNGRPYRYSVAAVDATGQIISHFAEITATAAPQ